MDGLVYAQTQSKPRLPQLKHSWTVELYFFSHPILSFVKEKKKREWNPIQIIHTLIPPQTTILWLSREKEIIYDHNIFNSFYSYIKSRKKGELRRKKNHPVKIQPQNVYQILFSLYLYTYIHVCIYGVYTLYCSIWYIINTIHISQDTAQCPV